MAQFSFQVTKAGLAVPSQSATDRRRFFCIAVLHFEFLFPAAPAGCTAFAKSTGRALREPGKCP